MAKQAKGKEVKEAKEVKRTAQGRSILQVTIDDGVLGRVDEYAKMEARSRSDMVNMLLEHGIEWFEDSGYMRIAPEIRLARGKRVKFRGLDFDKLYKTGVLGGKIDLDELPKLYEGHYEELEGRLELRYYPLRDLDYPYSIITDDGRVWEGWGHADGFRRKGGACVKFLGVVGESEA